MLSVGGKRCGRGFGKAAANAWLRGHTETAAQCGARVAKGSARRDASHGHTSGSGDNESIKHKTPGGTLPTPQTSHALSILRALPF